MRIAEIGGAAGGALSARAPSFEKELARAACDASKAPGLATGPAAASGAPVGCGTAQPVDAPPKAVGGLEPSGALSAVDRVVAAQQRLDAVLRMASEGNGLSAGALLALQADVYRSSQLLELAGKVVERATSGVKQVLSTQL